MQKPIFILWTRSFWLGVLAGGAYLAQDTVALTAFIDLVGLFLGETTAFITERVLKLAPVLLGGLSLQQRSGSARPYTINPKALQ